MIKNKNIRKWLSRFLRAIGLSHLFIINRGTYKLYFFRTALSSAYWVNPTERVKEERFLQAYLKPGDVYVDVGANIGALTLTAASVVGDNGKVYAFEAHPRVFSYLKKNVELNMFSNIRCYNCTIGRSSGVVSFSDRRSDDQNSILVNGKLQVPIYCLDEIIEKDINKIHLLKVDVEGYEGDVFSGSGDLLKRTDCVYFEINESCYANSDRSISDVLQYLRQAGFNIYQQREQDFDLEVVVEPFIIKGSVDLIAVRSVEEFYKRCSSRL